MPSASVITATIVNVGCLNNERAPWRRSCHNVSIADSWKARGGSPTVREGAHALPHGRATATAPLLLPLRFQLPQHVDDYPTPVELRDVQIINPIRRHDLHARDVFEHVKHSYIILSLLFRSGIRSARSSTQRQRHRAHLVQSAASRF